MKIPIKKANNSIKGFSLLELMLVLIILSVIMTSVFSALVNGQKTFDAELANAQAQENARYAVDRISEIVQTAGNNPQNLTVLNGLNFIRLYDTFNATTPAGSPTIGKTIPPTCGGTSGITCPSGKALQLFSDFDGDALTNTDVGTTTAGSTIFSANVITSENVVVYLDPSTGLVNLYNYNPAQGQALPGGGSAPAQGSNSRAIAIAEFVTDLNFIVDSLQNQVTISVTARSNRAVAIETVYEKRFRYASLVSVVKLRNR
ncbi:MAG: prepilin-type N-terminal cleavage/methylation domain-containing protein [Acidobacteria bacterium]|nr:prepilin-type N-terminal cleavage/methylation domain-containing protein [Acidobacteriota bacterium]